MPSVSMTLDEFYGKYTTKYIQNIKKKLTRHCFPETQGMTVDPFFAMFQTMGFTPINKLKFEFIPQHWGAFYLDSCQFLVEQWQKNASGKEDRLIQNGADDLYIIRSLELAGWEPRYELLHGAIYQHPLWLILKGIYKNKIECSGSGLALLKSGAPKQFTHTDFGPIKFECMLIFLR